VPFDPKGPPVLSGVERGVHNIPRNWRGLIPKVLDVSLYGEIIKLMIRVPYDMPRDLRDMRAFYLESLVDQMVYSAFEIAKRPENRGPTIVTILCDTAERYLTTELFS